MGNAAGGREAHGGVDGFSVEDRSDAGAVAEVRDDEARWDGIEASDDGLAGEPVEAVADDASIVEARGYGEMCGDLGQRAVKGGVEAGEVGCVGERLLGLPDERECLRDVQRSELDGGFEGGEDFRCDALVFAQMRATVHDAMANGDGCGVRGVAESGEDGGEGFGL
jgi:hypothetical protein